VTTFIANAVRYTTPSFSNVMHSYNSSSAIASFATFVTALYTVTNVAEKALPEECKVQKQLYLNKNIKQVLHFVFMLA